MWLYSSRCFLHSPPSFDLERSPSIASHHHWEKTHLRTLSILVLFFLRFWLSSRMTPRFIDFILSLFISLFTHLVAAFIADHVSGGSLFRHICYSKFGYYFSLYMLCALGRLFMVSSLSFGFSVVSFNSSSLSIFYLLAGGCASAKTFYVK
ncbi:hypothetical protein HID58_018146 [Brassica napus]|uniref:Uncharacterized protein n=1 Tax=Brassica napus TaxID=3708 RepID=A0ABQ8D930_BRANA|nr:hypothetical protein HID58_018146 [Brassica napus]